MVRTRSLLTALAATSLAGLAVAQTPRPLPPGDRVGRPLDLPDGPPGLMRPPLDPRRPGAPEGEVDDVRPWLLRLTGQKPPKDIDPKLLKDLMDQLNKLPKDQQPDPKQIEKLLKDNPQFKDPEFLKQLEKLVEHPEFPDNLEGKVPKFDPAQIPDQDGFKKKVEEVIQNAKQDPDNLLGKQPDPKVGQVNPDQGKGPDGAKAPDSPAADNEWVKWLEKNFKDSPSAEAAMKDLVAALEKPDGKGLFDDLPEFKKEGWKDFEGLGKNSGNDWKFKPPELGGNKMTPPNIGGGGSSGPMFGGGSAPSAPGVGLEGGGSALAVIAGIVGALVLAVLLYRKWNLDREQRAAAAGAMRADIDFDAVRSREELVRVFDAVSLGRCGEEARNWNHRVIAEQIADAQPAHAEPADEVAGLYERARYAPQDEDLTAGEFATARQDLRVIAGAPA